MKNYDVNETLLGDGVGIANFVYFILSGRCQMIESLQVVVKTHLGRSYYSLYDPYVSVLLYVPSTFLYNDSILHDLCNKVQVLKVLLCFGTYIKSNF